MSNHPSPALHDAYNRRIDYARLSVTDRCDFRCVYCMAETMQFLPRAQILSLEELLQVAEGLAQAGIRKLRLTGGEPLIRKNIMWLVERLARLDGLEEISLTTNGSQLASYAGPLAAHGVQRVNISLDTLCEKKFRQLTRSGDLQTVLRGIEAARGAGFKKIKLNCVVMKGRNDDEILELVSFAANNELDIAFIEEMPLGAIDEHDRARAFCSSDEVKQAIEQQHTLLPSSKTTNGPSRYYQLAHSDTHIGFISPHSNNFCSSCNRIRVTVEGRLLLCLGNEHSVDLRQLLREQQAGSIELAQAIARSLANKPERHYFNLHEQPEIVRFMNMTGG